ncbi:surface protein [Rhizobium cauense]|uniref:surface protein n=1 Tax=Rhizobium cauense TaxID=1166683 RepID=UPI001C6F5A9D|nr:surface protein [Rhizobium cauense]MBW9112231.1 surface protein [Rhizobium cauense]
MRTSRFASSLSASALLVLASVTFADAAPVPREPPLPSASSVETVQYRQQAGYLNGYRGSRTERAGTRRASDGYWYPLAAFRVDPGTTGSIGAQPRPMQRHPYCQNTFGGTNGDGSMPCDNGY